MEMLLLILVLILIRGLVDAGSVQLYHLKLDRTTADIAALAADLPAIDRSYDVQLEPNINALFQAAKNMLGKGSDTLGMRIEWHQKATNYQLSWSRGRACRDLQKTLFATRPLRTDADRSHAEFVQVELCMDIASEYFDIDHIESRAISVRRWWKL